MNAGRNKQKGDDKMKIFGKILIIMVCTTLLLSACSAFTPAATPTAYPTQAPYPTGTPYPTPTPLPTPTLTPTQVPPPTAIPVVDPMLDQKGIIAMITSMGWKINDWACTSDDPCVVYDNSPYQIMVAIYTNDLTVAFNVRPTSAIDAQNGELQSVVTALFGTDVANWVMTNLQQMRTQTTVGATTTADPFVDGHPIRIDVNDGGSNTIYYGISVYAPQ
jgi:hypothetical protein